MTLNGPRTLSNAPRTRPQVIPLLAEVISMGDGSFVLKPKMIRVTPNGDSWLTPQEAGKILGICPRMVYRYCEQEEPYLAFRRPARCKLLVSLKTVNRLYQATLNPDFWSDELQQRDICEFARQVMDEWRED